MKIDSVGVLWLAEKENKFRKKGVAHTEPRQKLWEVQKPEMFWSSVAIRKKWNNNMAEAQPNLKGCH